MKILLLIFFAILFLITTIYENYFRDKERENIKDQIAKVYGKLWHWFQWFNWLFVFSFVSYLIFGFTWLAVSIVFFIGSAWWILFDGSLNSLKKRYFFFQSQYTTSEFEPFANIWIKLLVLAIAIMFLAFNLR